MKAATRHGQATRTTYRIAAADARAAYHKAVDEALVAAFAEEG